LERQLPPHKQTAMRYLREATNETDLKYREAIDREKGKIWESLRKETQISPLSYSFPG